VTGVETITSLSERLLRERTFELVVAPAIADLQFDSGAAGLRRARNEAAVVAAFAWGLYEDLTHESGALTFATLAMIPACYYTFLVMVCAPDSDLVSTSGGRLTVAAVISVVSLGPVIACYWPERQPRRLSTDAP
jgi:hypothetical protein